MRLLADRTGSDRLDQPRVRSGDAEKHELKEHWVIPPEKNAETVAAMEDVIEVYQRPYDPQRPVVYLAETSKQLVDETRTPIAARPGTPAREDYD